MDRTSISITHKQKRFNYLVEYIRDIYYHDICDLSYVSVPELNRVDVVSNMDYIHYENTWLEKNEWRAFVKKEVSVQYLPATYNMSTVRVNFPDYSPETYNRNVTYMMTINTWINGVYVYLGSKLLNRINTLANSKTKQYNGHTYFEYIDIPIIDPFDIQYSDNWKNFRRFVCGERVDGEGATMNNTGAQLYFSLYIVENNGELWFKDVEGTGGQASLNISTNVSDYMTLNQSINFEPDRGLIINEDLVFNDVYGGDIVEYFTETYGIKPHKIKYTLVVKDDDNIYKGINEEGVETMVKTQFNKHVIFTKKDLSFDSWDDWNMWENDFKTSVFLSSSVSFYDDKSNQLLYIRGNDIPLTKEIYKYLINDSNETKYIDLGDIDMEVKNFNIVNKIINQVVQFDRPDDSKSNIIQPVFFRVRDLQNLVIHPQVTENICINLDAYKSKVSTFIIQIEGCNFKQIGSNNSGIIFKIIGKNLPKETTSGVYYMLDDNYELVTTGKYTYEQ